MRAQLRGPGAQNLQWPLSSQSLALLTPHLTPRAKGTNWAMRAKKNFQNPQNNVYIYRLESGDPRNSGTETQETRTP